MKFLLLLSISRRRREFHRIPAIQDVEARTQQSLGFSETAIYEMVARAFWTSALLTESVSYPLGGDR